MYYEGLMASERRRSAGELPSTTRSAGAPATAGAWSAAPPRAAPTTSAPARRTSTSTTWTRRRCARATSRPTSTWSWRAARSTTGPGSTPSRWRCRSTRSWQAGDVRDVDRLHRQGVRDVREHEERRGRQRALQQDRSPVVARQGFRSAVHRAERQELLLVARQRLGVRGADAHARHHPGQRGASRRVPRRLPGDGGGAARRPAQRRILEREPVRSRRTSVDPS